MLRSERTFSFSREISYHVRDLFLVYVQRVRKKIHENKMHNQNKAQTSLILKGVCVFRMFVLLLQNCCWPLMTQEASQGNGSVSFSFSFLSPLFLNSFLVTRLQSNGEKKTFYSRDFWELRKNWKSFFFFVLSSDYLKKASR